MISNISNQTFINNTITYPSDSTKKTNPTNQNLTMDSYSSVPRAKFETFSTYTSNGEYIIPERPDGLTLMRVPYSMPSWVNIQDLYGTIGSTDAPGIYDLREYISSGASIKVANIQKAYEAALRDFGLVNSNPNAYIPTSQLESLAIQVENDDAVKERFFEYLSRI